MMSQPASSRKLTGNGPAAARKQFTFRKEQQHRVTISFNNIDIQIEEIQKNPKLKTKAFDEEESSSYEGEQICQIEHSPVQQQLVAQQNEIKYGNNTNRYSKLFQFCSPNLPDEITFEKFCVNLKKHFKPQVETRLQNDVQLYASTQLDRFSIELKTMVKKVCKVNFGYDYERTINMFINKLKNMPFIKYNIISYNSKQQSDSSFVYFELIFANMSLRQKYLFDTNDNRVLFQVHVCPKDYFPQDKQKNVQTCFYIDDSDDHYEFQNYYTFNTTQTQLIQRIYNFNQKIFNYNIDCEAHEVFKCKSTDYMVNLFIQRFLAEQKGIFYEYYNKKEQYPDLQINKVRQECKQLQIIKSTDFTLLKQKMSAFDRHEWQTYVCQMDKCIFEMFQDQYIAARQVMIRIYKTERNYEQFIKEQVGFKVQQTVGLNLYNASLEVTNQKISRIFGSGIRPEVFSEDLSYLYGSETFKLWYKADCLYRQLENGCDGFTQDVIDFYKAWLIFQQQYEMQLCYVLYWINVYKLPLDNYKGYNLLSREYFSVKQIISPYIHVILRCKECSLQHNECTESVIDNIPINFMANQFYFDAIRSDKIDREVLNILKYQDMFDDAFKSISVYPSAEQPDDFMIEIVQDNNHILIAEKRELLKQTIESFEQEI